MIEQKRDYLLFDGDCGVCTAAAAWAASLDAWRCFTIKPYQSFNEAELSRYGIAYADCQRKLQVITRHGRVYAGAFGVNYFLWQRWPVRLLVLLIYALPPLLLLEVIGYALIARHRRRLSIWLGLTACAISKTEARATEPPL